MTFSHHTATGERENNSGVVERLVINVGCDTTGRLRLPLNFVLSKVLKAVAGHPKYFHLERLRECKPYVPG